MTFAHFFVVEKKKRKNPKMKTEGDEIDPQGLVNSMMESWRTDFMKAKKLNYTNRSSFEMADKMIR